MKDKSISLEESADNVVMLMKQGWQLAKSAINQRFWLQQGGCGNGGVSKTVEEGVMGRLIDANAVIPVFSHAGQRQVYKLNSNET